MKTQIPTVDTATPKEAGNEFLSSPIKYIGRQFTWLKDPDRLKDNAKFCGMFLALMYPFALFFGVILGGQGKWQIIDNFASLYHFFILTPLYGYGCMFVGMPLFGVGAIIFLACEILCIPSMNGCDRLY